MPENLKEQTITGKSWVRCGSAQMFNPYNATPAIVFNVQKVTEIEGEDTPLYKDCGTVDIMCSPEKASTVFVSNGVEYTYQQVFDILSDLFATTQQGE